MKVKVCGIRTYEDASAALEHGVDALGFNFYPRSPRFISVSATRAIIRRLPPFAVTVGLFVDVSNPDEVAECAREAGVEVLQLHGDESPEYCARLAGWPLIKAVRMNRDGTRGGLDRYPVHAFLLDSGDERLPGGTGKTFDWRLTGELGRIRPIILAGGLTSENVAHAIRTVQPYGVDVCSGVESQPGTKDPNRIRAFMDEVRHATEN